MLELNKIYNKDCLKGMKLIKDNLIDLIITSPPYAQQRKNQYKGVPEKEYPLWTVKWMKEVKRILKPSGSVGIVIRSNLKNGIVSRYVLNTRIALQDDGWVEPEELIWIKPDSPPLGSINRPRRAWEQILWFSLSGSIYCDPKANGTVSNRIGFENNKFEHGGKSHIHAGQNNATQGIARCRDYIECGTGKVERGINHPAMYPVQIPEYFIKMCCPENGIVLDPFMGSGTTAIACINTNRNYIGFEKDEEYYELSLERIKNYKLTKL